VENNQFTNYYKVILKNISYKNQLELYDCCVGAHSLCGGGWGGGGETDDIPPHSENLRSTCTWKTVLLSV